MATSDERDGRKMRLSQKGLNSMIHITSECAQTTSSSSSPVQGHDHHQPPLDQTKDEKKESFDAARKRARDERRKTVERGLNRMSRPTNQSNPPKLDHHWASQTYPTDQTCGTQGGFERSCHYIERRDGLKPLQETSLLQNRQPGQRALQR